MAGPRLENLRQEILDKVRQYQALRQAGQDRPFEPGQDRVNYAGRWFDAAELVNLVDASLEFWLTHGPWSRRLERELAGYLGTRHCALVNSGSSANLLAFMTLTSPLLGPRAIGRGDEVITTACGFPTTLAPIVQAGAVPVFVDVSLPTANLDPAQLEAALSPRCKAVFAAHTLGNPFDLATVGRFCQEHGLWLIEDNCDALGSEFQGRRTGSFGDLATLSFYPAHHITTGEGGAVLTSQADLRRAMLSLRDWGRDCWCDSGHDDTCGRRFSQQFGSLPQGYDHKYVYSHFGYNLKMTDLQAAIGCAQVAKLGEITARRRHNFAYLREGLAGLEEFFILPQATPQSQPSWFGFLLTLRPGAPFGRARLVEHLEGRLIQTRNLFGGNLVRQPLMRGLRQGRDYRCPVELKVTDQIMRDSFWVGVYPGMDQDRLDYMVETIRGFVARR